MPEQMIPDGLSDKLGNILSNPALMRGIMSLFPAVMQNGGGAAIEGEGSPVPESSDGEAKAADDRDADDGDAVKSATAGASAAAGAASVADEEISPAGDRDTGTGRAETIQEALSHPISAVPESGKRASSEDMADPEALFAALRPFLSKGRRERLDRLSSLTGVLSAMGAVGAAASEKGRDGKEKRV